MLTIALMAVLSGVDTDLSDPVPRQDRTSIYPRVDRRDRIGVSEFSLFRILPASGAGAPVMNTDLCSAYSSEMVGNYVCMRGDGSFLSGGVALEKNGAPVASTKSACPNGPDCSVPAMQASPTASDFWRSGGNVLPPSGDFSVGAIFRMDDLVTNRYFFGINNNAASATKMWFGVLPGPVITLRTTATAGGVDCNKSNVYTPGAYHFVVYVYHSVGIGNSTATPYVDGVAQTACTNLNGPIDPTAVLWAVGGNAGGGNGAINTSYGSVFITEKLLDAATIQAMSATAFGAFTGTRNETITFARASSATATASSGSINVVPANRPRISSAFSSPVAPSLLRESANTNLAIRSRDLSNAAWTKTSMTCTLNATGRDGVASSASTCTATGSNATVLQALTVAAAARATAFDVKGVTLTGAVSITRDNDSTRAALDSSNCFDPGTGAATAPNTSTTVRCWVASSVLNPTIGLKLANSGDSIVVDFAQDEDSATPTSPIITTSASVARAADVASVAQPTGWGDTSGCAAASYRVAAVTASARVLGIGATNRIATMTTTNAETNDGTNTVTATAGSTIAGRTIDDKATWTGSVLSLTHDGVTATGTYDGTMTGATVYLGSVAAGASGLSGYLSNIRLGGSSTACDR